MDFLLDVTRPISARVLLSTMCIIYAGIHDVLASLLLLLLLYRQTSFCRIHLRHWEMGFIPNLPSQVQT